MRYVQINSFYNGSTGTIMRNLHHDLQEKGIESFIFWGRRHETINDHEQCIASRAGVYSHGGLARFTDRAGFYSHGDTRRFLAKLDEIRPDVVHLHNIHGYYINVAELFEWLATQNCKVIWTLHDCWAITGHCPHFQYVGCERWKTGCHDCPQLGGYPTAYFMDQSERNWKDKRRLFTMLSAERMLLVSPSQWLADLVGESYLSKYDIMVQPNKIDEGVFHPVASDVRERYGIGSRCIILGVASPWGERKGLNAFIQLAKYLDDRFAVVIIGLSRQQIKVFDEVEGDARVIALERTESREELVRWYSAADFFFNPTMEDNYPTVNLEAEACGTPVVTFDTGGCRETVSLPSSCVVDSCEWTPRWFIDRLEGA